MHCGVAMTRLIAVSTTNPLQSPRCLNLTACFFMAIVTKFHNGLWSVYWRTVVPWPAGHADASFECEHRTFSLRSSSVNNQVTLSLNTNAGKSPKFTERQHLLNELLNCQRRKR
jgi:hypothetical protein